MLWIAPTHGSTILLRANPWWMRASGERLATGLTPYPNPAGKLILTLGENDDWSQLGVESLTSRTFADKETITLGLSSVAANTESTQGHFSLRNSDDNSYFSIANLAGDLVFMYTDPGCGEFNVVVRVPYNPNVHNDLRLRRDGDLLHAEVKSRNVRGYTVFGTHALNEIQQDSLENVNVVLRAVTHERTSNAGAFSYDYFEHNTECNN